MHHNDMAKKSYNSSKADYIKISFKCDCGKVLDTGLIPVCNLRSYNKDEYPFSYDLPIECSRCHKKHLVHFYDDNNISCCEIPSLVNDDSIIYLREIPYEYAYHNNTMYIDFIQELSKAQQFLDAIDSLDTVNKQVLYRMALTYLISIMDVYLGNTFRYWVKEYEKFKQQYENPSDKHCTSIERKSFQDLNMVVIPYYKRAFHIELSANQLIQDAVHKRNRIIHHGSREKDGYEILITASEMNKLIAEIESFASNIENKVYDVVFEEIIMGNSLHNGM